MLLFHRREDEVNVPTFTLVIKYATVFTELGEDFAVNKFQTF